MNLYLVRHAEPKREQEDPQRPLSEKGLAEIRKIASFICEHSSVQVSSVMHSGKTRARQTAEVLAEHLRPPDGVKEKDGLNPLDAITIWSDRLAEMKDDIMLVGHLPHLSKLSASLLCQGENRRIIDFHMAGIVCLTRAESGIWSVRWMLIPQIL